MTTSKKEASYLDWQPVLKANDVYQNSVNFSYVQTDAAGNVYWIEQRPNEEGRSVLVQRAPDGKIRDLTPKPISVRTRVFEYGASPYAVAGDDVYYTNFTDQRIYRINLKQAAEPVALTPATNADGSLGKYAELTVSPDGRWLFFDYEIEPKQGEHPNYLGLLDLKISGVQEATIAAHGASFYKAPRFSADGSQVAWLEWNHPYMSWDSTRLYLAPFRDGHIDFKNKSKVAGSDQSSISDVTFGSDNELFFAVDTAHEPETSEFNYYNIHGFKNGKDRAVTKTLHDYSSVRFTPQGLLCVQVTKGQNKLVLVDPKNGDTREILTGYADVGAPAGTANGVVFLAASPADRPTELISISGNGEISVIRKSSEIKINSADVSRPEPISFVTQDAKVAYGYYYPPVNSHYSAPTDERPPVRVLVHGGPTAMTSPAFMLSKLFWTSQGYAIFDVNYRGSFGYGREYRDALNKKWGELEIEDVKDGLIYLTQTGRTSGQAIVSGGSAGGYTVQRLLTSYPDLFAAGASYFGIGNLVTLQKLTHKFESHYLEQLIGGTLQTNLKTYEDRSPINHLNKLKSPMIIFQGSDDKVVPPENSREMADILKRKGIEHEYYEYPGEAHGFRKRENLVDALEKESQFYKRVLKRDASK